MPKHIYVIAGHGAGDPGAIGNGYKEAERVRVLAQRMADLGGEYVHLHPLTDNAYASGAISRLNIPKDWEIVEPHMDSAASSAKGAHVIIKTGLSPDAHDRALERLVAGMFPGRSVTLAQRSNLANVNRAAARGYSYRLVENGFISNAGDVATFNANIDALARGYLAAFDIIPNGAPATKVPEAEKRVEKAEAKATGNALVKEGQKWLNVAYGTGLAEDGLYGPKTKKALVKALQSELNQQFGKGLAVDGIFGPKTKAACVNVREGARGDITKVLQLALVCNGHSKGGFDGIFGSGTRSAVEQFQKAEGLAVDGIAGKNTWSRLLGA